MVASSLNLSLVFFSFSKKILFPLCFLASPACVLRVKRVSFVFPFLPNDFLKVWESSLDQFGNNPQELSPILKTRIVGCSSWKEWRRWGALTRHKKKTVRRFWVQFLSPSTHGRLPLACLINHHQQLGINQSVTRQEGYWGVGSVLRGTHSTDYMGLHV